MIGIYKHGKFYGIKPIKYIVKCPKCNCIFEFEKEDYEIDDSDRLYVDCPECTKMIYKDIWDMEFEELNEIQ